LTQIELERRLNEFNQKIQMKKSSSIQKKPEEKRKEMYLEKLRLEEERRKEEKEKELKRLLDKS